MHKQKVYLETTMFNYFVEESKEDSPITVAFFEAIKSGQYEGYTSALDASEEAKRLADIYVQNGIIPEKKNLDAQHIAIATINENSIITQ